MEPPGARYITVLNDTSFRVRSGPLKKAVSIALSQQGCDRAKACLLLTDDAKIRDLNRSFRDLDEPTDVLTFPSGDLPPEPMGDVAISVPYAVRQAEARGVSLEQELGFLAIHGALHLAGLADEEEGERAHMVSQMNRAATEAGFTPDEAWASILHDAADKRGDHG
jgi:rRNA maturation RNase YbeY